MSKESSQEIKSVRQLSKVIPNHNLVSLRTVNPYFNDIFFGKKKFETRKVDPEKPIKEGTKVLFCEIGKPNNPVKRKNRRYILATVTYLFNDTNLGLQNDFFAFCFDIDMLIKNQRDLETINMMIESLT